ncbi:MAG: hypothetical protein IIZ92_26135 [Aquincola sp.]|nr:hypothetical protein [Aquincola sp.]
MSTRELKLDLPERLANDAEAAGLLTPKAMTRLLKEEMRRQAAQQLLAGAARATAGGSRPRSLRQLQAEVDEVRQAQRPGAPGAQR